MGKLAKAAGAANGLTGKVAITDRNGITTTYDDEARAEATLSSGCSVEHRRGGFFLVEKAAPAAPTLKAPEAPRVPSSRPKDRK